MELEPTIGLEVHVQLKTRAKVFAPSAYAYGVETNTLLDPVTLALPGTLPVLNEGALRQIVKLGLMLGSEIAPHCKFDRKNYFYPDLPKNYQISQYDEPVCLGGSVEIELPGPNPGTMGEHKWVQLTRVHLEEDPGKLSHSSAGSLIDFNRAGAPLAEIVTEPVVKTADEAVAFLNALRLLLTYAGVSDCDMEKGQMRCDANVSLAPIGSEKLGTRTEMKNLNSISAVKAAIQSEIRRQTQVLLSSGTVDQETRRWDAERGESFVLRSKEEAHDYRYFPDPDLMPVELDETYLEPLRKALPERPYDRQKRYLEDFGVPYSTGSVLVADYEVACFFENTLEALGDRSQAKAVANLVANNLLAAAREAAVEGQGRIPLSKCGVTPVTLAELVSQIAEGKVIKDIALKQVFPEMFATGKPPSAIIADKGLEASSGGEGADGELEKICRDAIADPKHAKAITQHKEGNPKPLNALMGPVMKATKGKANPPQVQAMLKRLVEEG
ncbi:MAG: Asp-tRNA(Asn)/Glu-tRNA(Gln) amidotransferase subunit GatB [Opitutales bacterium]